MQDPQSVFSFLSLSVFLASQPHPLQANAVLPAIIRATATILSVFFMADLLWGVDLSVNANGSDGVTQPFIYFCFFSGGILPSVHDVENLAS